MFLRGDSLDKAKLDNQLCFEVYRAANQFTKLYTKVLQPFQLTYPQYLVLLVLWDQDEQTSSSIGEKLGLGIGTLNPILQKLLEKGRLTKKPSPTDRRAAILSLTEKAKQEERTIEEKIINTMFCFDYLAQHGPELKQKVHELNEFLGIMNKGEQL